MTDSTQTAAAQDTTASAAGDVQSGSSLLTPEAQMAETPEATTEASNEESGQKPDGAPEEYGDFTFPEGAELDADVLTEFKGIAKELGLPQEKAQALIDLQAKVEASRLAATQKAMAAQAQQWADAVKADKEIGGDNYDKSVETAVKAIEKFGSPELRTYLNESGLGNHPELVKFCHRIGKALTEDTLVMGGTQQSRKSDAEVFYGSN